MRVLLDTNIVVHREAARAESKDIGVLFRWLDNLAYTKCVHPITVEEIQRLKLGTTRDTMLVKLGAYNVLQAPAAVHAEVERICSPLDATDNDRNDTALINELFAGRVDALVSQDRKLARKAQLLGIGERLYTIDTFLEKVTAEHPGMVDYRVLSVKKELFGRIDVSDPFFETFRGDYPGFERWFNGKSEETAYVCRADGRVSAFLYLKIEDDPSSAGDIRPILPAGRRLKIGSMKVESTGHKLGERFLKIAFDNAIRWRADLLYVTLFRNAMERERLVALLEDFGFVRHGVKHSVAGEETVYVRDMVRRFDARAPKLTYPYFSRSARAFIVPIYPPYHTSLFPESILRTESPADFVEQEPHRNAISKVYVSRSIFRALLPGDVILFYRTGGFHASVASTIGIVEDIVTDIPDESRFIALCRKRSVFADKELSEQWRYRQSRPFIVNFLYAYSLPKRPNMARLIELGVIADVDSAPRGFERISAAQLNAVLKEAHADDHIAVD